MSIRLVAVMVVLSLMLVGCFRQAGDDFQAVDSQSSGSGQTAPTVAPETPLPLPTIEATEDAALPLLEETEDAPPVTVIVPDDGATATEIVLPSPTEVEPTATNTEEAPQVVASPTIGLPTSQPAQTIPTDLPTATQITIITPGAPVQVQQPTVTPRTVEPESTDDVTAIEGGLATPTALPEAVDAACTYTIRAGDNLFRIALRNNTTVDALQSFNNLPSAEVIQPGQELQIPNCAPEDDEEDDSPLTDSGIVHVVQSGETLGAIARRYGTTINDILEFNPDITNPDALSVGQEIAIPE